MSEVVPFADKIIPCRALAELADAIRPPRHVIILFKAGEAVDKQINNLREVTQPGDIIIDAGNANFHDTIRRDKALADSVLTFIGMGISGGGEGARHGPAIMVGSAEASYVRVEKVLTAIAAKFKKQRCCAWGGPGGVGHFVKMIHSGIAYADKQIIAEFYGVMRDGLRMKAPDFAAVFATWNRGKLDSYLIEITTKVLAHRDVKTGKPLVDLILDKAGQKGTGKSSVMEAQDLEIRATAIEAAVAVASCRQ